jgi:beta-glucanase (GH16 family)
VQEMKFDNLPWIISNPNHLGIQTKDNGNNFNRILSLNKESKFELNKWRLRDDTFPSNLAIFNPNNIKNIDNTVLELNFNSEKTSVRSFTSAALVTKEKYLYGRFSVELRPSNVSGLITGIFLHRNSPHQEIDIEFLGKDTTKMLINVFFNPGIEGSKMEYGYRGTPVIIDLGFDAHDDFHLYEIHWQNNLIKWYVDGNVVYERGIWEPTPIPYLPMEFNVNLWHSQSKELAGALKKDAIPAKSIVKDIKIHH